MSQREILLDAPRIKTLNRRGEVDALKEAMVQAELECCQTFDMALFALYSSSLIGLDQALSNADIVNNRCLEIKVNDTRQTGGECFELV